MKLTKKDIKQSISNKYFIGARIVDKQMFATMCQELLEYKDIEEELGIDLITLFKALTKEYIFIKQDNKIYENNVEFSINKDEKGWYINLEVCHFDKLYFKDYGKTWALTKEELLWANKQNIKLAIL